MEIGNPVKNALKAGESVLCLCVRMARTADIGAIAAAAGFEALYVDLEHSSISADEASAICAAAPGFGVTPLVRVPEGDLGLASRLLDNGAMGVILPHVETASRAQDLVDASLFPPYGKRSAVGSTVHLRYAALGQAEIAEHLNELTLTTVMIETETGVANADEIAAVPGIDMVMVGTNDLSAAMGLPGEISSPEIRAACQTIADACARHGKTFALGGVRGDARLAADFAAMGARFVIAGMDASYLLSAAKADAAAIRGALDRG
jgi:2-keto-3-deoxy-L-rhamnonate aldolase RhmA